MSAPCAPYSEWLGVTDRRRPPTHYSILGVADGEPRPNIIAQHAQRQTQKLQEHLAGPNRRLAKRLLFEIEAAQACLSNDQARSANPHGSNLQQPWRLHRERFAAQKAGQPRPCEAVPGLGPKARAHQRRTRR